MNTNGNIKVGDKVIYVPKVGSRPVVTSVSRLTPSGQIGIPDTKGSFRHGKYGDEDRFTQGSVWSDKACVYLFSEKRLAKLTESADAREARDREEAAERERKANERATRIANQMRQVREVCNNTLPIRSRDVMPGGCRLVLLDVPINPEHPEKQFDLLIVRISEYDDFDWNTSEKEIRPIADSTYITAKRGFVGRSSLRASKGETDDDLLWALVRDRYFDWD